MPAATATTAATLSAGSQRPLAGVRAGAATAATARCACARTARKSCILTHNVESSALARQHIHEALMERPFAFLYRLLSHFSCRARTESLRRRKARRDFLRLRGEPLEERRLLATLDMDPLGSRSAALPLAFELNAGQADSRVNYLSRGNQYTVFLTPGEADDWPLSARSGANRASRPSAPRK